MVMSASAQARDTAKPATAGDDPAAEGPGDVGAFGGGPSRK